MKSLVAAFALYFATCTCLLAQTRGRIAPANRPHIIRTVAPAAPAQTPGPSASADDQNVSLIFLFVMILVAILLFRKVRKLRTRSRYIPVKSKRLAQAELYQKHYSDPKTANKPLRLRNYEYDHHKVPYSRGGTSDPENIKLITRKENRRKGNRILL